MLRYALALSLVLTGGSVAADPTKDVCKIAAQRMSAFAMTNLFILGQLVIIGEPTDPKAKQALAGIIDRLRKENQPLMDDIAALKKICVNSP